MTVSAVGAGDIIVGIKQFTDCGRNGFLSYTKMNRASEYIFLKEFKSLILKISDVFLSFPQMVLIIIMVALVGQSLRNMILIFILTGWPSMYRMARSKVLSLKEAEFVQALNAFGISSVKIAFKHLLPNTVGPIVVNITLSTAMFILQEASLSVLGYGVPQEIATWGNIINVITNAGSIRYDWLGYWWMWLPCAAVLVLFVLAINFIGDGLRDASDPTQIG